MPTPAAIPRSPFVPRTAQRPYSHVGNSTKAKLDRLELTALRAMVDVEPYGSSDLGGDPSDDEPPSMTSASPSEDDDPEDPENPSGKKKKKKKKTRRPGGRRSQALRAHLDQVPLNYPSETVVQPSSTAHFHSGFPTVEPLSWYSKKLLSSNLKTAIFQPCKRCGTP